MATARKGQTVFAVTLRGFYSVPFILGVVSLARLGGSPTPTTQTRGHVGEPQRAGGKNIGACHRAGYRHESCQASLLGFYYERPPFAGSLSLLARP